jgi:signal transduction histidine kinase/ActR/RegA family two-component response regulator
VIPAPGQSPEAPTRFILLTRDVTDEMRLREELAATMGRAETALVEKRALLADLCGEADAAPSETVLASVGAAGTMSQLFAQLDRILTEIDTRDLRLASVALQLRDARARAEAANLAKSQFLANMSHELRTPLNAIIGYSEILIEDLSCEGRKDSCADAERVRKSALQLLAMINDILDLSRIDANEIGMACEPVDVAALAREVLEALAVPAALNGNAVNVHADPGLAPALTDGARLRQALANLVGNAVKFTHQGRVDVVVRDVTLADGSRWHEIEVSDSGIGMPAEVVEELFKPFTQADGSSTRLHGGTGLGLALAKEIITALGGEIAVLSALGQGSSFTVRLPVRSRGGAITMAFDGDGLAELPHVLVIDDDPQAHALAKQAVRWLGLGVKAVQTGAAALIQLQRERPSLIILDLDLPDMGGLDVLAAIRGAAATRQVPVLVVSAHDERSQSIVASAQEHLLKPCAPALLTAAVARLIRQDSGEGPSPNKTTEPATPLAWAVKTRRG